jgi:peptidoglycan-associated lipoprotein
MRRREEVDMRLRLAVMTLVVFAAGCATATQEPKQASMQQTRPAAVDVTGRWQGTWVGYGILDIPREEPMSLVLIQQGDHGEGRLVLDGANAAESVPLAIRHAGGTGSRITFDVVDSTVVVKHDLDGNRLRADLKVDGDKLVGYVSGADQPLRFELTRVRPRVASLPEPAPAPEPEPQAAAPSEEAAPPVTALEPTPEPEPAVEPSQPSEPPYAVAAARPEPQEFARVPQLKAVHFDFDKADIRSPQARILDANADWLLTNDETAVLIEGHCDERGTNEYNLALGERRARAIRDYLVSRGVPADRMSVVTYGEERPLCRDKSDGCWRENRRAVLLVRPR